MCLLILARGGATPSKKSLRRAGVANPDGFGFAIIGDNKIHTFKSMDLEDTIDNFYDMRERYPKGHAIFHLRITTHGVTNVDNCHPFRVNEDVVMGHNGMLPIKEENGKSDTHLFATEWLPQFDLNDLLETKDGIADLSKFATGSKLAFLNVGKQLSQPFYIINEHLGHWQDGVWYSNSSYKEYSYKPGSYIYTPSSYTTYHSPDPRDAVADDKVWDDERIFDGSEFFDNRSWNKNDLVYDYTEGSWTNHSNCADSDSVEWECNTCGTRELFDLMFDQPEYCVECGTCWYCDMTFESCQCDHQSYYDDEQ